MMALEILKALGGFEVRQKTFQDVCGDARFTSGSRLFPICANRNGCIIAAKSELAGRPREGSHGRACATGSHPAPAGLVPHWVAENPAESFSR